MIAALTPKKIPRSDPEEEDPEEDDSEEEDPEEGDLKERDPEGDDPEEEDPEEDDPEEEDPEKDDPEEEDPKEDDSEEENPEGGPAKDAPDDPTRADRGQPESESSDYSHPVVRCFGRGPYNFGAEDAQSRIGG